MRPIVLSNPTLTYQLLKEKPDKQIESFFYFLFDGNHQDYEEVPPQLQELRKTDEEFYKQLIKGFKRAANEK